MNIVDIIIKKRDNFELSKEEIEYFVDSLVNNKIELYQASALLMAILLNGMNDRETTDLTRAMLNSGDLVDLSEIKGIKADKHSSGGVGDKTSLVLAPLLASLGIKVAKMSGRGLGHTGGTLDKLESIPGFNVNIDNDSFIKQVNEIGCAIVGQSKNLVPADKIMYSLRDVTGTVSSIPLIASSIMSKKLATNTDIISLDVKVGSGAFMKDIDSARTLARLMINIGKMMGRTVSATLTNMDTPLGCAVGNSLEVIEAINTLCGKGPKDFIDLCASLASEILFDAKLVSSLDEGYAMALNNLNNGKAYNLFKEMVKYQGGDTSYIDNIDLFPKSKYIVEVKSKECGYIKSINALTIGHASMMLGAGREKITDIIDHKAGILLNKQINDYVEEGELLLTLYTDKDSINNVIDLVYSAYSFDSKKTDFKLILDIIN